MFGAQARVCDGKRTVESRFVQFLLLLLFFFSGGGGGGGGGLAFSEL